MLPSKYPLLADEHAIATPLVAIAIDNFGIECFEWDAEALSDALIRLNPKTPQCNLDKAHALITLLTTDVFYKSAQGFIHIANCIGGEDLPVNFEVWELPSAEEAAWSIYEAILNEPPSSQEKLSERFASDVLALIRTIFEQMPVVSLPKPLDFIQPSPPPREASFSDEPEFSLAIQRIRQQNSDYLKNYLEARALLMIQQLKSIDFQHGTQKFLSELNAISFG